MMPPMIQSEGTAKKVLRWVLTVFMVAAGVNHFVSPSSYTAIMPAALPWHLALVYISGVAEILGGLGLILPATRRLAAWGLVALFIAIFPANVNMAVNQLPLGNGPRRPPGCCGPGCRCRLSWWPGPGGTPARPSPPKAVPPPASTPPQHLADRALAA